MAPYIPSVRSLHTSLAGEEINFEPVEPSALEDIPPQFISDMEVLRAGFDKFAPKGDCTNLWGAIRRSVQIEGGPARGKRHLVLYSQSEAGQPVDYPALTSTAMASRTSVHAVSLIANPALEGLCQATQGTFQAVASEDEVVVVVEQICLSLLARYTVRYQPTMDARELRIIVTAPPGWGEATIPIPALPTPRAG
jgi:hypothetical protein